MKTIENWTIGAKQSSHCKESALLSRRGHSTEPEKCWMANDVYIGVEEFLTNRNTIYHKQVTMKGFGFELVFINIIYTTNEWHYFHLVNFF